MTRLPGWAGMAAILLLAAILLAAYPARVLECDAVIYACAGLHHDVVQSTDAGHLIWGGVEVLAAGLGRTVTPPWNPIFLLRWLSAAAALGGAWLVFVLLSRSLRLPVPLSVLLAGTLLFSYSYWHFALQAEPHLPHTLTLIGFLLAVWSWYEGRTRGWALVAGVLLGAATLFHQTTILLVPVTLGALLVSTRKRGGSWLRNSVWFLGGYFLTAIVPYLVVGWFVRDLRTIAEFREWIMGLSSWGYWGHWRITGPVAAVVGIVRSFVGSHYLLGFEAVQNLAQRLFPHASWEDELMLAAVVPTWLRVVLLPIQIGVLAGVVWLLPRSVPRLRRAWESAPAFGILLVGWLVVHGVFFTWWAPERAEFWIAFWLPLIVLAAPGIALLGYRSRWGFLGLAGLLVINLGGSIAPQSAGGLEMATLAAVALDPVVQVGDVMLTDIPLSTRAGRFVYSIDIVGLPASDELAAARIDSLLQAVSARGRTLYWVSGKGVLPAVVTEQVVKGSAVPVRGGFQVIALKPSGREPGG